MKVIGYVDNSERYDRTHRAHLPIPERRVMLLFPPIPMPAWVMVTGYALIELATGVLGTDAGVAHFAHLGGMLGAYLMLRHYRASAA